MRMKNLIGVALCALPYCVIGVAMVYDKGWLFAAAIFGGVLLVGVTFWVGVHLATSP